MRNSFVIIALSSLLFLAGCGQQQEYVDVQGFSFIANTIVSVKNYDNVSIYVLDNSRTTSGDIMTVLHQEIDPQTSSDRRTISNITTLQQTYPGIVIINQSPTTFGCDNEDVEGTLVVGTIPTTLDKDPLYFVQHFFIHKGIGYVFTYSSSHEKSVTSMGDNWENTYCSTT